MSRELLRIKYQGLLDSANTIIEEYRLQGEKGFKTSLEESIAKSAVVKLRAQKALLETIVEDLKDNEL